MIRLGTLIHEKFMNTRPGSLLRRYYRYYMMPSAVRRGSGNNLQWLDVACPHRKHELENIDFQMLITITSREMVFGNGIITLISMIAIFVNFENKKLMS